LIKIKLERVAQEKKLLKNKKLFFFPFYKKQKKLNKLKYDKII
jgi:hypothetical protein